MNNTTNMIYPDGRPVGRYSSIGNDVLEKVADIELTRAERKVLDRIIKDTIGYPEKNAWTGEEFRRVTYDISLERFVEKTGLAAAEIDDALFELSQRLIIWYEGYRITFNHHLEDWL